MGTLHFVCSSLVYTTRLKLFCIMCYKIHGDRLINLYDKKLIKNLQIQVL